MALRKDLKDMVVMIKPCPMASIFHGAWSLLKALDDDSAHICLNIYLQQVSHLSLCQSLRVVLVNVKEFKITSII